MRKRARKQRLRDCHIRPVQCDQQFEARVFGGVLDRCVSQSLNLVLAQLDQAQLAVDRLVATGTQHQLIEPAAVLSLEQIPFGGRDQALAQYSG